MASELVSRGEVEAAEVAEESKGVVVLEQQTQTQTETETDLIAASTGSVEEYGSGLGDFDQEEDGIVPWISIGQEKTVGIETDEIGKFRSSVEEEVFEELKNLSLITVKKTRCLMPEEFDPDNKPLCRSTNYVTPMEGGDLEPMSESCKNCEYAKWGRKQSGKPKPPRCSESFNLLFINEEGWICWQDTHGTALSSVKKFLTKLSQMVNQHGCHAVLFNFSQKVKRHAAGAWVPEFTIDKEPISDPERREFNLFAVQSTKEFMPVREDTASEE